MLVGGFSGCCKAVFSGDARWRQPLVRQERDHSPVEAGQLPARFRSRTIIGSDVHEHSTAPRTGAHALVESTSWSRVSFGGAGLEGRHRTRRLRAWSSAGRGRPAHALWRPGVFQHASRPARRAGACELFRPESACMAVALPGPRWRGLVLPWLCPRPPYTSRGLHHPRRASTPSISVPYPPCSLSPDSGAGGKSNFRGRRATEERA